MTDPELARLQHRYRALTEQIRDLGFIATGSVTERYTVCTAAGCRCHHDPPERHGPYLQHTRKVAGKTVTTRLTAEQAQRYRDEIGNRRRLDELIAAMDEISTQARELLLDLRGPPSSDAPTAADRWLHLVTSRSPPTAPRKATPPTPRDVTTTRRQRPARPARVRSPRSDASATAHQPADRPPGAPATRTRSSHPRPRSGHTHPAGPSPSTNAPNAKPDPSANSGATTATAHVHASISVDSVRTAMN